MTRKRVVAAWTTSLFVIQDGRKRKKAEERRQGLGQKTQIENKNIKKSFENKEESVVDTILFVSHNTNDHSNDSAGNNNN